MAALTWRNVDAPNIDVRGLALATQGVTGGLDQLSQLFMNRELEARKLATDNAVAESLRIQDPQQLAAALASGQIGAADPRGRVDQRAVLEAANAQRSNLISTGLQNENLLNSQAQAEFGTRIAGLRRAAEAGDPAAQQAYQAEMEANPEFGRVALEAEQQRSAGYGLFEGRQRKDTEFAYGQERDQESDRQWKLKFDADRAAEAARLSLQRRELEARENERGRSSLPVRLGTGLAKELATMNPGKDNENLINEVRKSDEYQSLDSLDGRKALEETVLSMVPALQAGYANQRSAVGAIGNTGKLVTRLNSLSEGARNDVLQGSPAAQAYRAKAEPGTVDFPTALAGYSSATNGIQHAIRLRSLQDEGYTLEDIDATARILGPSGMLSEGMGANRRFNATLKEVRELGKDGGFRAVEEKQNTEAAPYDKAARILQTTHDQVLREMVDAGRSTPTEEQAERIQRARAEAEKEIGDRMNPRTGYPEATVQEPINPTATVSPRNPTPGLGNMLGQAARNARQNELNVLKARMNAMPPNSVEWKRLRARVEFAERALRSNS